FVLLLAATAALSPWVGLAGLLLGATAAAYLLVVLACSITAGRHAGFRGAVALALVFPVMHVSYGLGFLRALGELLVGSERQARLAGPLFHHHQSHRRAHLPRRRGDPLAAAVRPYHRQPLAHPPPHLPGADPRPDGRRVAYELRSTRRSAGRTLHRRVGSRRRHLTGGAPVRCSRRAPLSVHVRAHACSRARRR